MFYGGRKYYYVLLVFVIECNYKNGQLTQCCLRYYESLSYLITGNEFAK